MTMRRTTVFAEEEDLATLKAAAARQGIAEAELLRNAIHLEALAHRVWNEPFFADSFEPQPANAAGPAPVPPPESTDSAWDASVEQYERTKRPTT